jgi:NAD(P)-dependent dehydrogenase (short-subunit alcohol dehydrogenase family)
MSGKKVLVIGQSSTLQNCLEETLTIHRSSGANHGIGLNMVRTFVRRGWVAYGSIRPQTRGDSSVKDVCIQQTQRTPEKKLTRFTYKLEETGAKILEIDYINEASIIAAAKAYGSGTLDCLVNCTGKRFIPI